MSNSAFTPTVLTISSGTGSGSGEKNYITNPSMALATTGWNVVGDFTLTRTTAASELPREYTTATGIKLVATSGTQSTADYMYFDFNLDDVDLGKKLKIQWSQKKIGTYSAGQLAVVITSQADRTTALITPQTTAIPANDLDFVTSFDSTTTAALSLVIRATTDMTTGDGICISDVIVGPGEIVQGAAISEWQTYTPTGAWTSNVTYAGKWRRVGNCMEVSFDASLSGAPNSAAFTINLPTGYTIDTSSLPNTFQTSLTIGSGTVLDSGTRGYPCVVIFTGSSIQMYCAETTGASTSEVTQANPITFGSADNVTGHFTLPIAEWSGSGTVNLGPGAQVEYASNTGAGGTAANTDYTSGSVAGPDGSFFVGVNATTVSGSEVTKYAVSFQYPIQNDDDLTLEVFIAGTNQWTPVHLANGIAPITRANNAFYGMGLQARDANSVWVIFGNGGRLQSAGYGVAGASWAGITTSKWRVRKAKASSPVGFGKADSTSFGLVGPRRGQYDLQITGGGWSNVRSKAIYYQDQDGNHRLKFNISGNITLASSYTGTIAGVTFANNTYGQPIATQIGEAGIAARATLSGRVDSNAGTFFVSSTSGNFNFVTASGDVELASKPTWA